MAKQGQKAKAQEFQVGDVVRVTKAGRHKGKLARIDDVYGPDRPYLLTWLTTYNGGWYDAKDIKLHQTLAQAA